MKNYSKILSIGLLTIGSSQAAVSITGTGATGVRSADNLGLALGSLAFIIADTGDDGFGSLMNKSIAANTTLNVGDTFGGDLILARSSTTQFGTAPNNGRVPVSFSYDNPAGAGGPVDLAPGTAFAIVWFSNATTQVASTVTATAAGMFYGVASVTSGTGIWELGTQTSGTYGFAASPSGTNIFKNFVAADFGNAEAPALNNSRAAFQIIPEPSAALLGAFGVLGLLRRRRI